MNKDKFKLTTSHMLEAVEDSYIKFMGDHWKDDDLESQFKELISKNTKHTVHARILDSYENLIIIETSKYIMGKGFFDHQIWMFHKWMPGKYNIHITRYTIS